MTLPTADLISEVLRLDEEAHTCDVGDLRPIVVRLADIAPELARRLRDAEEKLKRAEEALRQYACGQIRPCGYETDDPRDCPQLSECGYAARAALASKGPGT